MTQIAIVKEIDGDGFAVVEASRRSACAGCEQSSGCENCFLIGGQDTIRTRAKNTVGAGVGDRVMIEAPSGKTIGYAVLVFLFPLLAAGGGYGVAHLFRASEGTAALVSLAAFLAAFAAVYAVSRFLQRGKCGIEITKVLDDSQENMEEGH